MEWNRTNFFACQCILSNAMGILYHAGLLQTVQLRCSPLPFPSTRQGR